MAATILVTGATGSVGTEVVKALHAAGHPLRIAARDPDRARARFGLDAAEVVRFDFTDPSTFADAFRGIARLFLVRPPALSNVARDIAPALRAAAEAGVQHVVFLSIQGVEANQRVPHYQIEQTVIHLGLDYTFLRCGFFMQNLVTAHCEEIQREGVIAVPVGRAKTSFIDTRDIAAVAAKTLTEDGHVGHCYTLTGAQALDYYEVAAQLSTALDREITYTNPAPPVFFWRQWRSGGSMGFALVVTALYTLTRMGNAAQVSEDTARLLGRPPISFAQFVQDYRDAWRG